MSAFCNNCGTLITDEPGSDITQRKPCPKCGSLDRRFLMKAFRGEFSLKGGNVSFIYISYPEKLLTAARDLIDKGEFSIAVVVAHMACEISVERALSRSFKAKDIDYLQKPIKDLGFTYNLANDRVRKLYNAVSGDEIQKQSFWEEFKASAERRNDAVHEGKIATTEEAEASFNAASNLVAYLK